MAAEAALLVGVVEAASRGAALVVAAVAAEDAKLLFTL
jgi:hypothetical protein